MKAKFVRRGWYRYLKLGQKRKKKQVWRSPKGRHNKMREKRRGYAISVNDGYRGQKDLRGKIDGKVPVLVQNLNDMLNLKKDDLIILANVGTKNKIAMAKHAQEKGLKVWNFNIKKFLKENKMKEKKK